MLSAKHIGSRRLMRAGVKSAEFQTVPLPNRSLAFRIGGIGLSSERTERRIALTEGLTAMSNENVYGFAGPKGSVAIGSEAATALGQLLEELEVLSWSSGDAGFNFVAHRFKVEISRPNPDRETISKCWKALQAAAIFNGALGLVERMESLLRAMRLA